MHLENSAQAEPGARTKRNFVKKTEIPSQTLRYNHVMKIIPLERCFAKPAQRVHLRDTDDLTRTHTTKRRDVPPVLYHGTTRFTLTYWQNYGIANSRLSTDFKSTSAAMYGSYFLSPEESTSYRLMLRNGSSGLKSGRKIIVSITQAEELGIMEEYERMQQGNVVQSLAFFDRYTILAGRRRLWGIEFETEGGILVRQDKDFPKNPHKLLKALFAAMHYFPQEQRAEFVVFDPRLWNTNFSVPPPSPVENVEKLFRRKLKGAGKINRTSLLMYCLARQFIRGGPTVID